MTIQIGDRLPNAALFEFIHQESEGCSLGPNQVDVEKALSGKTIAIFALPGAYTPTCSAKHAPQFIDQIAAFKAKGVDEVWCISVNDAFVMGEWGNALGAQGKIRMLADGSAEFTQKIGMELDLISRGMGVRSQRYSMLVKNGVVVQLNLDAAGQFENSTASRLLSQL